MRKKLDMPLRGGDMVQPWFSGKNRIPRQRQPVVALRFPNRNDTAKDLTPHGTSRIFQYPNQWTGNPLVVRKRLVDRRLLKTSAHTRRRAKDGVRTISTCKSISIMESTSKAVYLVGDFGVQVDGTNRTLTTLPESLEIGDVTAQRLPFYSGSIRYIVPNNYTLTDGKRAYLSIPSFEGACVKVSAGDKTAPTIAWPPYEADVTELIALQKPLTIDVVLTRRNTFGPLHQIPLRAGRLRSGQLDHGRKKFHQQLHALPSGPSRSPANRLAKTNKLIYE